MSLKEFSNYADSQLYRLVREDDQTALEALFQRYYTSLCQFTRIYVKDETVCEEIISDLFIKLWAGRFATEILNLRSYLFTSARNLAFNFSQKKTAPLAFIDDLSSYENVFYNDNNPHSLISDRESYQSVIALIDMLPDRQREILLMSRVDNLDKYKIAEVLSISVRTVETTLYAAINQLRSLINLRKGAL